MKNLNHLFLFLLILVASCKKDQPVLNTPPETQIFVKQISLTGTSRLNSVVELHWSGTDKDGYITGYELSFDNSNWSKVYVQDSTFKFSISAGSDTSDIKFYVRAIDDQNVVDPTPAFLNVPIKNTPPTIIYRDNLMPSDTVKCIVSLAWEAFDPDGDETLDSVLLKINNGAWFNVKKTATMLSIVPQDANQNGAVDAKVYYTADDNAPQTITGLRLQDTNRFYIKTVDIAKASSKIDTSARVYVRNKTGDLLLIGGNNSHPENFYFNNLNAVHPTYDFVDYTRSNGKFQPKFWTMEFELLLRIYGKAIIYLDKTLYIDALSNQSRLILESASTALQNYFNKGGKALISAKFPPGNFSTSSISQTMPFDSLSSASKEPPGPTVQAYMPFDSLAVSFVSGYPNLETSSYITRVDPFYPTSDGEVLYKAQIGQTSGWYGPKNIAVRRKFNGKTNLVFFSVELHLLNGIPAATQTLFDHIINNEFNW